MNLIRLLRPEEFMDRCTETASLISFETFQVDRDVRINVKTPPVMSKRYGFQYHVLVISGMLVKKPRFWDLNAELQAVGMCLCYSPREIITVWINTLFGFLNQLTQRLPKWLWLMDVDNEWIPTPHNLLEMQWNTKLTHWHRC